jgi:hypothetical protein
VVRHIFQACPVWIYTQSNITNIIFTWVHNTNTKKSCDIAVKTICSVIMHYITCIIGIEFVILDQTVGIAMQWRDLKNPFKRWKMVNILLLFVVSNHLHTLKISSKLENIKNCIFVFLDLRGSWSER